MKMWNESVRIHQNYSFVTLIVFVCISHGTLMGKCESFSIYRVYKLISSNEEQNPDYTPEAAESRSDDNTKSA
jgi:hypothetical protein